MIGNSGSKYDYQNASIDNNVNSINETIELFETQLKIVLMKDIKYYDGVPMSKEQRLQSLLRVAKWYKELA